jgi:hypothetical protein
MERRNSKYHCRSCYRLNPSFFNYLRWHRLVEGPSIIQILTKMTAKEKALYFISAFSSTEDAFVCIDVIISDLNESSEVAISENMHGHAKGIISGSLFFWREVRQELKSLTINQ